MHRQPISIQIGFSGLPLFSFYSSRLHNWPALNNNKLRRFGPGLDLLLPDINCRLHISLSYMSLIKKRESNLNGEASGSSNALFAFSRETERRYRNAREPKLAADDFVPAHLPQSFGAGKLGWIYADHTTISHSVRN